MNVVIKSVAVVAIALCATSYQALAAESSASEEMSNPQAVQKVAQADTRLAFRSKAGRSQTGDPYAFEPGKRGAHAAALQGPDALRHYIDRTRMIYALDYNEFSLPQ